MKTLFRLLALCSLIAFVPHANALDDFVNTGSMNEARGLSFTQTLLPNGKVLVAGGERNGNLSSAELYDPATGVWTRTGSMIDNRSQHTATLLPNGKVLVIGGSNNSVDYLSSAELYDPSTGTWSTTGSMIDNRSQHTATLLANGKVLVTGGYSDNGSNNVYGSSSILYSAELYDPATGAWSATGSMNYHRYGHTAILLATGKVLVFDGSRSPELYDPVSGGWSPTTGPMSFGEGQTMTLLANGKVLVTGGHTPNYSFPYTRISRSSAQLYDPATGVLSETGSMIQAREYHAATLLANGKVLVAGGRYSSYSYYGGYIDHSLASAELYDPATGRWSTTGSMNYAGVVTGYTGDTAILLTNHRVLVYDSSRAELYRSEPDYSDMWTYTTANNQVTITGYTGAGGAVAVPVSIGGNLVTMIGDAAFSPNYLGNSSIASVTIPNSVIRIANSAFSGCTGLTSLIIPDSVTSIGDYAFQNCSGLTSLTVPKSVTSIGNQAFFGCSGLTSVTIPSSVTSIGNQAFFGCSGLMNVSLPERFITDIEYIGLSSQVAANTLIQGVADNLSCNSAFITSFTSSVLSKSDNYGLATKADLSTAAASFVSKADLDGLVTKTDLATAITPLASKSELVSLASRSDLSTAITSLASKTDLSTAISPLASKSELASLASNSEFVAALLKNPDFMAELAKQIASGVGDYGRSLKQNQTLSFPVIPAQTYAAKKKVRLAAKSSANLSPIIYTCSNAAVATVSGSALTLVGKGTATITATQAGNSSCNSATASQVLTVK